MAKGRSIRERSFGIQTPPPVRIQNRSQPFQTNASLKHLLSAAGRVRQPGGIAIYSGVAQPSAGNLGNKLRSEPLPGWNWKRWTIGAPPPGSQVLWLTLDLATQWWKYRSNIGATNTSSHYMYVDFGITWRWMLLPDQYYVPGAPASMQDVGTYEFYASLPPGDNTWTAWWVHPSRSVTLTPEGKESDPNALALLLRSERNGRLSLMFADQFPRERVLFNGYQAAGYSIAGGPSADSLHYSMAVVLPKAGFEVEDAQVDAQAVSPKSGKRPKPSRRSATR
jgi:hypothetical protein